MPFLARRKTGSILLTLAACLLLLSPGATAQEEKPKFTIEFKGKAGERLIYKVTVTNSILKDGLPVGPSRRKTTTEEWRITKIDPSGVLDFLITYLRVVFESQMGNELRVFDSMKHKGRQLEEMLRNPHLFSSVVLLGQHFRVRLRKDGSIDLIYDLEPMKREFVEKVKKLLKEASKELLDKEAMKLIQAIQKGIQAEPMINKLKRYVDFLPDISGPLEVGMRWIRKYVHYTQAGLFTEEAYYTVESLVNGVATISSTSQSEFILTKDLPQMAEGVKIQLEIGNPRISTTTRFDVKNGRLIESIIIVDLTFATTYSFGKYSHRMAQRRRKETRIELVEVIPPGE